MAPLAAMLTFLKMEVLSQLASGLVAKHVNKKNAGKPWLRSLAALAATFNVVAFYRYL